MINAIFNREMYISHYLFFSIEYFLTLNIFNESLVNAFK